MCYTNCLHENWHGECRARRINGKLPCELLDFLDDAEISYADWFGLEEDYVMELVG